LPATAGAHQNTNAGGNDVVISRLNSTLTTLTASTYIGGSADDRCYSLVKSGNGDIIIAGYTTSTNYPVTAGAFQTVRKGIRDIIISCFDSTLTNLTSSTYLGGSSVEECHSVTEAADGDIVIIGTSTSTDYPVTPNSFQNANAGSYDIVLTRISFITKSSPADIISAIFMLLLSDTPN